MNPDTFGMLRTQARLQLESPAGTPRAVAAHQCRPTSSLSPASLPEPVEGPPVPTYEVVAPKSLIALPRPDRGDLFFDFEGDPLHTEPIDPGRDAAAAMWGIDYLFGWVDDREQYTALWAHTLRRREAGARELPRHREPPAAAASGHAHLPLRPVRAVAPARDGGAARRARGRRRSPAERRRVRRPVSGRAASACASDRGRTRSRSSSRCTWATRCARATSRRATTRSCSTSRRGRSPTTAAMTRRARSSTTSPTTTATTASRRGGCATGSSIAPATRGCARRRTPSPASRRISRRCARSPSARSRHEHPDDSGEAQSLRLGAAAIDYYPREAKSFWATHFLRLREPVSLWEETRDVAVLDAQRCRVVEDWHRAEGQRTERRTLELRGELAPGTRLSEGSDPFALYELPVTLPVRGIAAVDPRRPPACRSSRCSTTARSSKSSPIDGETWDELPDRAHSRRRRRAR